MKERPILFNAPMVRAILNGSKTQTRRVVKGLPDEVTHIKPDAYGEGIFHLMSESSHVNDPIACPFGHVGDQLWVRETWAEVGTVDPGFITYKATYPKCLPHGMQNVPKDLHDAGYKWRPSIHMPRWASRIQLEITNIRVERLQDCSEEDAISEGLWNDEKTGLLWLPCAENGKAHIDPRRAYRDLWESINGAGSWDANPWVWVIEFRRVLP